MRAQSGGARFRRDERNTQTMNSFLTGGRRHFTAAMIIVAFLAAIPLFAQDTAPAPAPAEPMTTADAKIPLDQLRWMLKPLPAKQLAIEADAWQALLQEKMEQISEAELGVRRQNQQQKGEATASTAGAAPDLAQPAGATNAPASAKEELLANLTTLREERSALIDRLNLVLAELTAKGGDAGPYEKYRDAVSEVIVDVSDTSAVWTYVTGWLSSNEGGVKWLVNTVKFVVILVVFFGLAVVLGKATSKATSRSQKMSRLLQDFTATAVRRGTLLVGLLIGISSMGIAVGPVLAVITAAGFVIGLALQGTLSNFASGLLILVYRPFDVGDAVEAGGVSGSVTAMNLMSTQIKTWDNKSMIVPNNQIWGGVITNITGTDKRRVDMVFGIGYGDSIEKAQAILERLVAAHDKVLKDPAPVVKLHELGESSVNFIVRPWTLPGDYWTVYWDLTRQVKETFDREGVTIPFPQRDVHLYQASVKS